jgi:hypothetical protein
MRNGIGAAWAWPSTINGRGPWWNGGASHMNHAFPKTWFDRMGLVSLLDTQRRFPSISRTAGCGTARRVVWEDGGGDPPPTQSTENQRLRGPLGQADSVSASIVRVRK